MRLFTRIAEVFARRVASRLLLAIGVFAVFLTVHELRAQTVSFIYPSAAQVGSTRDIMLSGSGLNNAKEVIFSGKGITYEIVQRPTGNYLFQNPRAAKFREVMRAIMEEERRLMPLRGAEDESQLESARHTLRANRAKRTKATPIKINEVPTPDDEAVFRDRPYFYLLEKPSMEDLQLIFYEFLSGEVTATQQMSGGPITDALFIRMTVAPDAEPGMREVKVLGPGGMSRPAWFWVVPSPVVREIEPNEGNKWPEWERLFKKYLEVEPQEIPVTLTGQVEPGDIDRFPLKLVEGQQLVFDMKSRSLQPYIANAVPGWFTGLMILFDPDGNEVASASDYRFSYDPLMTYKVEKTGQYTLEIRDSIFRGRRDFNYQIAIGEYPIITSSYPLGCKVDTEGEINLRGGNLPVRKIRPDFKGPVVYDEIRELTLLDNQILFRPFHYMVETLPIFEEPLPKKLTGVREKKDPIKVNFPTVIYGMITAPAESDVYEFDAKKGDKIALAVTAQPIDSNMDAVLELRDASGKILVQSDDYAKSEGPSIGNEVHHSDPNFMFDIPEDGTYSAKIYNRTRKYGPDCFYRLRISEPQPDFIVCAEPSALRFNGSNAGIKCYVYEREGFNSEIELKFRKNTENFAISGGGKINPKDNEVQESDLIKSARIKKFTVKATKKLDPNPQDVELVAVAKVGDREIVRPVLFCDVWMQAFIWYHLVPANYPKAFQR